MNNMAGSGLSPETYFPNLYLKDLCKFPRPEEELRECGECGQICGLTSEKFILDGRYKDFESFPDFLAVTYWLATMNWQGVQPRVPYLSPYCSSGHGGVFDPGTMLIYFSQEIRDKKYLPSDELLLKYEKILAR